MIQLRESTKKPGPPREARDHYCREVLTPQAHRQHAKLTSIPDLSTTFLTKSNSLPGISLDVSPTSQIEHSQRQIYPLPPAYKTHSSSSQLSCLVVEGRNLGVIRNSFLLLPSPKVIKVCPFCLLSLECVSSFLFPQLLSQFRASLCSVSTILVAS